MPWSGTLLRWYWNREEDFILIWNMEISITPTWHFHFVSDTLVSHFQIQPLGIRSLNHMQCWEAVRSYCINIQSDREFPFSKWSSLKLIIFIHWLMRIIIVQQMLFLLIHNFNKVMVVHTFFKACLFKFVEIFGQNYDLHKYQLNFIQNYVLSLSTRELEPILKIMALEMV